jgi:dihydroorotate dehydrogenase
MYKWIRPFLFRLDPEIAHHLTLQLMRFGGIQPIHALLQWMYAAPEKPVEAFGLRFKNPVGLAAGYDKDGIAVRGLSTLGFGHIEIGTVTPQPQPGNPKPRIFRLVEDEAVINRMGFPGRGAEYVAASLRASAGRVGRVSFEAESRPSERGSAAPRNDVILGVNLGKNKDTPLEEAAQDYIALLHAFSPLADYLAINISSPNTVGLRRLQGREMLEYLLSELAKEREQMEQRAHRETPNQNSLNSVFAAVKNPPILVKLAPDLSDEEREDAVGVILDCGMDGIIVTNTTLAREGLRSPHQSESGGLSGSPLRIRSEAMLGKIVRQVDGRVPVVSVGGIMNPEDAKRRLERGATLVQVYTGLIYRGPGLVREIIEAV